MFGNLFDNVCKWVKFCVLIMVECQDFRLCIDIEDDGLGIVVEDCQVLLQWGKCGDEQVLGFGLGLVIVNDFVILYGGCLELLDLLVGGLCVWLWLLVGKDVDILN